MKKIICGVLAAGMIFSAASAFAENMTVEQAVEYALENSYEFAKKDAEIRASRYTAYDASSAAKSLKKNPFLEVNSFDTYLVLQGYYSDSAKLAVTVAERGEEDLALTVANSVKNDFYTYLNSLRSEELAKENLSIAEENLEAAKVRQKSGTLSDLDFKSFELGLSAARAALGDAERTRKYNLEKLKTTINYKGETELVPVGEFVYKPTEPVAYEKALELLKKSNTYLNLADSMALSEKRWYWAYRHYNANTNAYKVEKANFDKAKAEYEMNIKNLDLNILNMYNTLLGLKEQAEYLTEQTEYLKSTADAAYIRYEMGLVSAGDYRKIRQEYFSTQNELNKLELTYLVTNMSYELLFNNTMEDGTDE